MREEHQQHRGPAGGVDDVDPRSARRSLRGPGARRHRSSPVHPGRGAYKHVRGTRHTVSAVVSERRGASFLTNDATRRRLRGGGRDAPTSETDTRSQCSRSVHFGSQMLARGRGTAYHAAPSPRERAMADDPSNAAYEGVPEAYIRGVAPFMGYEFFAEPGTMYPREVSAILVNTVVDLVQSGRLAPPPGRPVHLIDQCGGSANIGCLLALKLPQARVWSTDLMPPSSALARRNVEKHHLGDRVEVATGDLFHALDGRGLE